MLRRGSPRTDVGAVALEALLALPLLALLLVAILGSTAVVVDQLAATRAARAAARTVAVTGDRAAAATVAAATSPGAHAEVRLQRGIVTVEVRLDGNLLGVGYTVDATAVAPLEPGA